MSTVTAFHNGKQIASGARDDVTRALNQALSEDDGTILVFEDSTGRITDLNYRDITPRTAGRPKLGVEAREVTLLPRHWDWLAEQAGGASPTLRRLVDEARRNGRTERERRDAAYRFMQALCGDMPHYEEALRALYSAKHGAFKTLVSNWPPDVVRYVTQLLGDYSEDT